MTFIRQSRDEPLDLSGPITEEERAEAERLGFSLHGMGPEDRAIARYLGISLIQLAEVNTFFHERTTMAEAVKLRASPRWEAVRAQIERGHRARLLGAKIRQGVRRLFR